MLFMRLRRTFLMVPAVAMLAACSVADLSGPGSVPSTQRWLIIDDDNIIGTITTTFVTVDKGGAMNQDSGPYRVFVTNNCSYTVPLSGNWNGTAVRITSTGGSCGEGYILTMTGDANDVYGKATTMTGTYKVSYTGPNPGSFSGTWHASFDH